MPHLMKNYAHIESPKTSSEWRQLDLDDRVKRIVDFIESQTQFDKIKVTRALSDGQVFVELLEPLPPAIRGTLLLDFENKLKHGVDEGLIVWCEPLGDKSTLRNLRGIEIRTERLSEPHR
jgi:hypothetical protein